MRYLITVLLFLTVFTAVFANNSSAQKMDTRAASLIDPDHFVLHLPPVQTREQWEARRTLIREQVLLRAGLWPEPPRTPLNARVFDEKKGEGFTVAKVYFESLPGFYGTGNLYRPTKGTPPYPAVITPHGHWPNGRLVNIMDGSMPARCIDFARMGFVVLAIDMIGFEDSIQFPHVWYMNPIPVKADVPLPVDTRNFSADFNFPEAELYGFSLGSLQLWNNIRGVDFLCSLPEVDPERIGVTGASGGGTQTVLLMTADTRIKVASPVCIVGAAKHPGCRCENFSGLWLDTSMVELCAAFAPKPLLLMSATEDPWTNQAPTREYPMIKKYYDFYSAGDKLKNVHITGGHNYNAETRAAVYSWFCTHLKSEFPAIAKPVSISPEPKSLGDLRVFPDRILPDSARTAYDIMSDWKKMSEEKYQTMLPKSGTDWGEFAKTFRKKIAFALAVETPDANDLVYTQGAAKNVSGGTYRTVTIGRKGKGDSIVMESLNSGDLSAGNVILVSPETCGSLSNDKNPLGIEARKYLKEGHRVYRIRGYASGELSIPKKTYDSFLWSSAYNRNDRQNGIQDVITAIQFVKKVYMDRPLTVVGFGDCGITAALACAVTGEADNVIADLNNSDPGYDSELLGLLPFSGIKRVGDFRTTAILLMNKPLTILHPGATFDKEWYETMAETMGMKKNLKISEIAVSEK
jgi:dienelactone hydrolase